MTTHREKIFVSSATQLDDWAFIMCIHETRGVSEEREVTRDVRVSFDSSYSLICRLLIGVNYFGS